METAEATVCNMLTRWACICRCQAKCRLSNPIRQRPCSRHAAFAQDILFDGWDFIGTLEHDVGSGFAGQFGVFMNGLSSDGNLDLHRWGLLSYTKAASSTD